MLELATFFLAKSGRKFPKFHWKNVNNWRYFPYFVDQLVNAEISAYFFLKITLSIFRLPVLFHRLSVADTRNFTEIIRKFHPWFS